MNRRAQLNFVNVLFVAIAFFFLIAVTPAIQGVIGDIFPASDNSFTAMVFRMFPWLLLLALVAVFFYYVFPRRAE